MDRAEFQEALLSVMEKKTHWAWPLFGEGKVPRDRLHLHLEHEYAVYVRDFPILVGRVYVQCPFADVRRELAANHYEEENGGIAAGRPHPELFLEIPTALGMDLGRFERPSLLPAAKLYREFLDEGTLHRGWEVAAAIATIFVEGNEYERSVLDPNAPERPMRPLSSHPLVVHYGLPEAALALTRVHRSVEGDHRRAAWQSLLDHAVEHDAVVDAMYEALTKWQAYRDDVAVACGLVR
jgi:pyrroloquinoline-quinone synthase